MTRRALSIVVGIFGFAAAIASLGLLLVGGSLMADARTANIAGPGVDVFVRTPYVRAGDELVLDIEARGGSRAGIESVDVVSGGVAIAHDTGHGANWGSTITDNHDRGSETSTVRLAVPDGVARLALEISVVYVVASSEASTFTNDTHSDTVQLDVPIYDGTGRTLARATSLAIAIASFLLWFGLVWFVAKLYWRAGEREPRAKAGHKAGEMEGIALVMGVFGGGVAGYWLFAWRISNLVESQSMLLAAALVVWWLVAPLWWARRWTKQQTAKPTLPRAELRHG